MEKDNAFYLEHIDTAIEEMLLFTEGMDEYAFLNDRKTQLAVVKCIEVIGEATKNISMELRSSNPNIPWKQMAGIRDILVHNYMDVNYKEVWTIVEKEIPKIQKDLQKLL